MKKIWGLAVIVALLPVSALAGRSAADCRQEGSQAGHAEGYRYGKSFGPQLGQGPGSDIEAINEMIRRQARAEEHAANRQECTELGFYQDWRNGFEQGFHIGMSRAREEIGPNPLPVFPDPAQPMHSESDRNPNIAPALDADLEAKGTVGSPAN